VHAVVRRVRCGLLLCEVTAVTANHGEHGGLKFKTLICINR